MRVAAVLLALTLAPVATGCGSGSSSTTRASKPVQEPLHKPTTRSEPPSPLKPTGTLRLPAARSGIPAATFAGKLFVLGGLSDAGTSTATVFTVTPSGRASAQTPLPGPVHDAAATVLGGRLLLFGGGQFEGSNRIIQVMPGGRHVLGTLPQALSDLEAMTLGNRAYVIGGWNGSATNRDIYSVGPGGRVSVAGAIPTGVRYAAAGVLGDRVIVAGGELASGAPTNTAYAFDPRTASTVRLPDLPAPIDHTAGIAFAGSFYVIGGLRGGSFSDAILSWRPGAARWRHAGRLPSPVADAGITLFNGRVALAGGRDSAGKRSTVELLSPVSR